MGVYELRFNNACALRYNTVNLRDEYLVLRSGLKLLAILSYLELYVNKFTFRKEKFSFHKPSLRQIYIILLNTELILNSSTAETY